MYGLSSVVRTQVKGYILALAIVVAILLKIPSLAEPVWNMDESIYLSIGNAVNNGEKLYTDIFDNKPPLIYLLAAISGGSFQAYRYFFFLYSLLTVFVFYKFSKRYFETSNFPLLISVLVFVFLVATPILEGNTGNAELLFILPIILGLYVVFFHDAYWKFNTALFVSGLLFGLAGLIKVPALIDSLVIFAYLFSSQVDRKIAHLLVFTGGLLLPFLISAFATIMNGTFQNFVDSTLLNNFTYVSAYKVASSIGFDHLWFRFLAACLSLGILIWYSAYLNKRSFLISALIITNMAAISLSSRPYTHYLLQGVVALSVLTGLLFSMKLPQRVLACSHLLFFASFYVHFSFFRQPVKDYYANYMQHIMGKKSYDAYASWFSPSVIDNYNIAQLIHTNDTNPTNKDIFVLSDNPSLYPVLGKAPITKYFVWYHIKEQNALEDTFAQVSEKSPKLIVVETRLGEYPVLQKYVNANYKLIYRSSVNQVYELKELASEKNWPPLEKGGPMNQKF
jgi:hypothetical protein